MALDKFDFPLGIAPWPSELRRRRQIKEGYHFSLLEKSTDSYRFSIMAGAGRIADIFQAFAPGFGEDAFFILEFYDEEQESSSKEPPNPRLYYSPYLPVTEIIDTLEPYLPRLIHDGFVGFGLANSHTGMELFYSEEKILTCFTENHIRVTDLLGRLGLNYDARLLLTSDLGHDHLSLLCHHPSALPRYFAGKSEEFLDYASFCGELADLLDMYPVEEGLSFFLSRREQEIISRRLKENNDFDCFADEDFGELLLSWHDFVQECEAGFEGDLWEYHQSLKLRDIIQFVLEGVPDVLREKISDIISETDSRFRQMLTDCRKRLDPPDDIPLHADRFWYRGMVRKQGAFLRRDLIRQDWFKP
ncbi:MAG: hypothetical protein R2940_17990 [Syntrophotaleaceae bacterium]